MAAPKETAKFKSIEDLNAFINSPKDKKTQKRQRKGPTDTESDELSKPINQYQVNTKKVKVSNPDTEVAQSCKKILDLDDQKHQEWRQYTDKIFRNITDITMQIEADYNAMKENEQGLEQLTAAFLKCIRQATAAFKQKLKALHDLDVLKKQFEEHKPDHKDTIEKLMNKLDRDIQNLRNKINTEAKRENVDRMRALFHKMQDDDLI